MKQRSCIVTIQTTASATATATATSTATSTATAPLVNTLHLLFHLLLTYPLLFVDVALEQPYLLRDYLARLALCRLCMRGGVV